MYYLSHTQFLSSQSDFPHRLLVTTALRISVLVGEGGPRCSIKCIEATYTEQSECTCKEQPRKREPLFSERQSPTMEPQCNGRLGLSFPTSLHPKWHSSLPHREKSMGRALRLPSQSSKS